MTTLANIFARRRAPAIGGAGIDPKAEGAAIASHYRYFRNVRGLPAMAARAAALELPAAYVKGREYYGPRGGAGAVFKQGGDSLRWIESTADAGLRFVAWADELARLGHTGWYTDDLGDWMTLRGGVWQLPGRNGEARLVYGLAEFEGWGEMNPGSAAICVSDIVRQPMRGEFGNLDETEGARDAARYADGLAERMAEQERDYRRAYDAGRAAAEADAAAIAARAELLPLLGELRALRRSPVAGETPAACKALRRAVDSLLETISEKRGERDSAWDGVEHLSDPQNAWRANLLEAWRAGFMDQSEGGFVRAVCLGYAKASDWRGAPEANPCGAVA